MNFPNKQTALANCKILEMEWVGIWGLETERKGDGVEPVNDKAPTRVQSIAQVNGLWWIVPIKNMKALGFQVKRLREGVKGRLSDFFWELFLCPDHYAKISIARRFSGGIIRGR